jgi:hypothetical protein
MKKSAAHNSLRRFGRLSEGRQHKSAPFHSPLTNDSSDFGPPSAGTRAIQGISPHPLTCTRNSQYSSVHGEKLNIWILVNLLVTSRRTGLYRLHVRDATARSGRPYGTCIVSHRTNELLINQKRVPDRQATSTVERYINITSRDEHVRISVPTAEWTLHLHQQDQPVNGIYANDHC